MRSQGFGRKRQASHFRIGVDSGVVEEVIYFRFFSNYGFNLFSQGGNGCLGTGVAF